MRRLFQILAAAVVLAAVVGAALVIPIFRNMSSEYGAIGAIHDLEEYIRQHDGRWPASPGDLGGKYPIGGEVYLDYSMTSSRLIESPRLLREAVRPKSGKFYTYPHYDEKINELHAVIRSANQSQKAEDDTRR
jgi:hypothetical protein